MKPDTLRRIVADAFAEALGRPIADNEDFFVAGGDSVAVEQVMTALSSALSLDLPSWLLLDHPAAGELAAAIARRSS